MGTYTPTGCVQQLLRSVLRPTQLLQGWETWWEESTCERAPVETLQAGIMSEGLGYLSNWGDLWKEVPQVTEKAETGIKHGGKTRLGSHHLLMPPEAER